MWLSALHLYTASFIYTGTVWGITYHKTNPWKHVKAETWDFCDIVWELVYMMSVSYHTITCGSSSW